MLLVRAVPKRKRVGGVIWCLGLCHGNFIMEIFIQERLNGIAGGNKEGKRILSEDVFHDLSFHFPLYSIINKAQVKGFHREAVTFTILGWLKERSPS